jgi:hypothetical protein
MLGLIPLEPREKSGGRGAGRTRCSSLFQIHPSRQGLRGETCLLKVSIMISRTRLSFR